MEELPALNGPRLLLRTPRGSDRRDRLSCGRNAEYVRMLAGDDRNLAPMTAEEADRWYARLCEGLAKGHLTWAIEVEGRCIGTAGLHAIDETHRRARYAVAIFDPAAWGQGFGTEATRLVLAYAFDTLGLHRVDLRVLSYNRRAIACYEKCGFRPEGIERECALVAGEWHDDIMMSVLEHEYRERSRRVNGNPSP